MGKISFLMIITFPKGGRLTGKGDLSIEIEMKHFT